jgi:hypothetical protein
MRAPRGYAAQVAQLPKHLEVRPDCKDHDAVHAYNLELKRLGLNILYIVMKDQDGRAIKENDLDFKIFN